MTAFHMNYRKNPNVLWVFYEDLLEKERFEVSVRAVASTLHVCHFNNLKFFYLKGFMDIHLDDELLEIVKDKCAFAAMKSMESKFDDHFVSTKNYYCLTVRTKSPFTFAIYYNRSSTAAKSAWDFLPTPKYISAPKMNVFGFILYRCALQK
jgi:hypothetical protein